MARYGNESIYQAHPLFNAPDIIVTEAAKSNPEAFGILYERHVGSIYGYIYNRVGNVPDAEELTSRTFFKALENIHRYEIGDTPTVAWFYRIAHNSIFNFQRDKQRHPTGSLEIMTEETHRIDHNLSVADKSAEKIIKKEEAEKVREAIAKLAEDRQLLLHYKIREGLPNGEIGKIMGKTEGAVKALLHRTLVSLRNDLKENQSI